MKSLKLSALLFSVAAAAACGGPSGPATGTTTSKPAPAAAADPSCPVAVPGTSVTVEDAPNGAALVFVTTGDVADVRRRAAALAQMHNEHHAAMGPLPDGTEDSSAHAGHDAHAGHGDHGAGGGHDAHAGHGDHGAGSGHDAHAGHAGGAHAGHAGGMIGVHSRATASDVEGGAKVTFVAGGADVAKLQGELRMHAQHLAAGTCAMGKSS